MAAGDPRGFVQAFEDCVEEEDVSTFIELVRECPDILGDAATAATCLGAVGHTLLELHAEVSSSCCASCSRRCT
jgi:hypothetical protein